MRFVLRCLCDPKQHILRRGQVTVLSTQRLMWNNKVELDRVKDLEVAAPHFPLTSHKNIAENLSKEKHWLILYFLPWFSPTVAAFYLHTLLSAIIKSSTILSRRTGVTGYSNLRQTSKKIWGSQWKLSSWRTAPSLWRAFVQMRLLAAIIPNNSRGEDK